MDAVDAAFEAVPRAGFLPRLARGRASYDGPIGIGRGQTNSQPRTVADMLRLLDVQPGQRVLDVGAGSGWTTALLTHLVGPTGEVLGVELEPDLVRFGSENLARTGCRVRNLRPLLGLGAARTGDGDRMHGSTLSVVRAQAHAVPARRGVSDATVTR